MIDPSEISDILKQQLDGLKNKASFEEVGTVLNVGDGVAHVYGLDNVEANELVEFENGTTGVAMNLEESNVGVILLNNINKVTENMQKTASNRTNRFLFIKSIMLSYNYSITFTTTEQ